MAKQLFTIQDGVKMTQIMLFRTIWMTSNKRSFVSGLFLRDFINTKFELTLFAHVLPKADNKYPFFRFYAKNIVLLDPKEHELWDVGTKEQRINYSLDIEEKTRGKFTVNWDRLKERARELEKEYEKWFPKHKHNIINYRYDMETEIFPVISKLNNEFWKKIRK